jgi:hypothetical protein
MVSGREVTFRFKIDLTRFDAKAQEAVRHLQKLQQQSGNAASGFDRLGQAAGRAGQQSAASAVNFQTATQGMLNLSTAAVQTYTSISNLDRANNRAKQSIIAVARAEDLLNNKIERRNQMEEKGIVSGMKYANIQREIATAEADLVVKKEKMAIEQAAVNDVYMLFATNVANVTISSLQTLGVLLGTNNLKTYALAAGTKVLSVATRSYTVDALTASKAAGAWTGATSMGALAAIRATYATHGLTAALKVMTASFAPLLIATAALTAAWAIHESDILGTKTALDKYLGVQDNFKTSVDAARDSMDQYNVSLSGNGDALDELPKRYDLVLQRIKELRKESGLATLNIKDLNRNVAQTGILSPSGFSTPSLGGLPTGAVVQTSLGIHQAATANTNVVRTETDSSFTAKAVKQSSSSISLPTTTDVIKFAAAGVVTPYNPSIVAAQKKQQAVAYMTSDGTGVYRKPSVYDTLNILDPGTTGGQITNRIINSYSLAFSTLEKSIEKFRRDFNLAQRLASMKTGETPAYLPTGGEYYQRLGQRVGGDTTAVLQGLETLLTGVTKEDKALFLARQQTALEIAKLSQSKNYLQNLQYPFMAKSMAGTRLPFRASIFQGKEMIGGYKELQLAWKAAQTPEDKLAILLSKFNGDIQQAIEAQIQLESEDQFLKGFMMVYAGYTPTEADKEIELMSFLSEEEFFAKLAEERAKKAVEERKAEMEKKAKEALDLQERLAAQQLGLSLEEYRRRKLLRKGFIQASGETADRFDVFKKLGIGRMYLGQELIFEDEKIKESKRLLEEALAGQRIFDREDLDYEEFTFMNLVQDALNATFYRAPPGVNITDYYASGGLFGGKGLILSNDDPRLKDTSNFGPIQLEVFKKTGVDIGRVAEAMPLREAERIANLEKDLGAFANTIGGQAAAAIAAVGGNATQAFQIGRTAEGKSKVVVPAWVKAQIREQDAWRNSVEGQNAQAAAALLSGGSFAYSRRVARAGGGLSQDVAMTIRAAGLLGVSVPFTMFETTANQVISGASSGLSQIMKETGTRQEFLFAAMDAITKTSLQVYATPYGWSSIRQGVPYGQQRREYQVQGLQNYVSRVAQGNFGIYDATVLNAMTGASVSEYTSEISDFNSKIAPLLNIAHSDFKTTLVDPKRGINEIDDRIRWTQRLEQISTGATVF